MKATAPAIACLAGCVAAAWLAGCKKGTLGHPDAGGAGPIMGVGARGASGIGGAGVPAGGIGGGFGGSGDGGRGGIAGRGTGGQGRISCPPPSPPVCGGQCGNGRIDSCVGMLSPECIPYALREECDGDDLGGATCAAAGFGSGKLVCDDTCSAASGIGCSECMPTAPSVVSCGTIPPLAAPYVSSYAIAATDSEVGLAEVAYNDTYGMSLSFRRLTPSLDIASNTTLLDPLQQGPLPAAYIDGVAVAPLPSGWVIASCLAGHLYLFTVEASGVSSVRVPVTIDDSGCGSSMVLAARPGGGPLLVWLSGYGMRGALIAADGQSAGTPFDLVEPEIGSGGLFDAAWVGDAFNVSLSIFLPPDFYDSALRIARVDVNGNVNGGFDLLMDGFEEMPRLARGATETRVTYVSSDDTSAPAIKWRRFGPAGEFLAYALVAEAIYNYTQSPAVAFGDDTIVLLADDSGQSSSLAITRVGRDGNIVTPRYDILRAPIFRIGSHDMVRRGPDAIVSWLSYGGLPSRVGLARITP